MTSTLRLWFSWLFLATHSIFGNITKMIAAEHLTNHRETENFGRIIQNETRDSLHTAIGDHETQESIGGEADLHKHRGECSKNPGHTKFIPVDTFTIQNLPEGHRNYLLYKYIKAIAELTVRVSVQKVSPNRPEVWPKTNDPYPFYNNKTRLLRTGSGMVGYVKKSTSNVGYVKKFTSNGLKKENRQKTKYSKCWCKKCECSESPSGVWWEFDTVTAAHVVFDEIEANHTSLRLFYDTADSSLFLIDKVIVVDVNVEYDRCILKCVTCDQRLGEDLEKNWKHYANDVWRKVKSNYYKSRDVDKLTFIVSHPHGCSKQVSIGHWKDKVKVDEYRNKFTYTTCTCPGTSGAIVQCVGYSGVWYELVHSGFKSEYNYSGAGYVL
ncbi:hypothetical protein BgiMline_020935 [Biomphalaria glabrata]|nr:hypothetical protein BgiMline_018108 [Biomphalaria glabrata]